VYFFCLHGRQAVIDLSDFPLLYSEGVEFKLTLPLENFTYDLFRGGKRLEGARPNNGLPASGVIHVGIQVPTPTQNGCGWFYRLNRSIFGISESQKTWVMLYDNKIHFYDGPWGSDSILKDEAVEYSAIARVVVELCTELTIPLEGLRIIYNNFRKRDTLMWASDSIELRNMWIELFLTYEQDIETSDSKKRKTINS